MKIEGTVPSRGSTGSDRPDETIGTGDGSTTKFYTDQAYIVSGTYSFRYSATEGAAGTALTETTHYTLDKDNGTLTLTAAGVTAVGTDSIYGAYSYTTISLTDTLLQEALDRAEDEIKKQTNAIFVDGTATTPSWVKVTHEYHTGRGSSDKTYFLKRYPIPDVSTTVTGTAVGTTDTTIYAVDTQGFPSSGYICIEDDKIAYTGKSGSAFTGVTGITSAHGTAKTIKPYTIEISTSSSGQTPSWTVLEENDDFSLNKDTGKVYLHESVLDSSSNIAYNRYPSYQIADRFRATYITGNDSVPSEIKRVCLMIASKELMHTVVKNKHIYGSDGFEPSMIDVDEKWIDETLKKYSSLKSSLI